MEDDGTPTGRHATHLKLDGLPGLVAAKTSPSLAVKVEPVEIAGLCVARITVPKSRSDVATSWGMYLVRRIKHDGTPECVPLLPHDRDSRANRFGLQDTSAQPVAGATLADFDPLERERVPTLTGLLVIGREAALRNLVPTHELAFQVLEQESVRFNEFRRFPLLKALDWLETNFRPFNPEHEVQVGLFRVPAPKVDMGAFREALANALVHRDYHKLGAVHVRLDDHGLTISNPGGLVEGVTLANLLTTEPRPRNPALADAMKRIGVVERSGRGVDKIYRGMLRFGRPKPDYSRTDQGNVIVQLSTIEVDEAFLHLVVEQGPSLPIDSLIALSVLREQKRVSADDLASHIHRDATQAKRTLESLVEAGLVQAHGQTRGRNYTLSAKVYHAEGRRAAYTRQAGFSHLQHEQMILSYAKQHGRIKRNEAVELCRLTGAQASKLLSRLANEGKLTKSGERRGSYYTLGPNAKI